MSAIHSFHTFGEEVLPNLLRSNYSRAFADFMVGPEVAGTAVLLGCYVGNDYDTIIIEVEVVLPQYPFEQIQGKEVISCMFCANEIHQPLVLAMRVEFPRLPHQGLAEAGSPRMLCLDSTTWDESKYRWSPSGFLEAIRSWLARAAGGTLHAPGQPREPLLLNPSGYLILPSNADFDNFELLEISGDANVTPAFLFARHLDDAEKKTGRFKAVCCQLPSREHGIIEFRPDTLADLETLCMKVGFDLRTVIAEKLRDELISKGTDKSGLRLDLLLVLHWDVTGKESPELLGHEEWAFIIKDAASVGETLGVIMRAENFIAPAITSQEVDLKKLANVNVCPLAILKCLDESRALAASGLSKKYPSTAVLGVGALGSKCIEILARQGLSRGILIDHDRLLPHNTGRHALLGCSVGWHKAHQMAALLNAMHEVADESKVLGFTHIEKPFTLPLSSDVETALREAECILDFSASVSVSRGLASLDGINRCISAFLTPGANTLFVHMEDRERNIRLDWVEAAALRAIVEDDRLKGAYSDEGSEIWFGGPCREVSTILPSENVALFAAACAGFITRHNTSEEALCVAYKMNTETMELAMVRIPVSQPSVKTINGWTIAYDSTLISHLKKLRGDRLPNETGGVLLGVIDRERRTCYVVIGSGSPPDSEEWPQSYVRGVTGLKSLVDDVVTLTAGQLQYVGEWHSHPSGFSAAPSTIDLIALDSLTSTMKREGLPAIGFVIGDDTEPFVLVGWNDVKTI